MADLPAHVLHEHKEVAQVVGVLDGRPQVRLQHGAEGGLALALPQPFDIADGLGGSPLHDDRQAVLPAEAVRGGANLAVVASGVAVIFSAGFRVYGVKNGMGVDVLPVHMDGDHRLKARQVFFRKLPGDLQGQLRRDLAGLKGLNHMVILDALLLSISLLGIQHLPNLPAWVAVQVDGEESVRFFFVEDVSDTVRQRPLPGQNFCDGDLCRLPSQKIRAASF